MNLLKFASTSLTRIQASLSDGDPRDLLDALLKGQTGSGRGQKSSGSEDEGITDDHVLMTAAEAFGAGVETTSTTLLWILAFLLHHPEVNTPPILILTIIIIIIHINIHFATSATFGDFKVIIKTVFVYI